MESRPEDRPLWDADEWHTARSSVELLWRNDFDRLKQILGAHVTLATVPETAVRPCPSVCVPAERPKHWFSPY